MVRLETGTQFIDDDKDLPFYTEEELENRRQIQRLTDAAQNLETAFAQQDAREVHLEDDELATRRAQRELDAVHDDGDNEDLVDWGEFKKTGTNG
ncbi:MAG: hypothetical protein WCW16_01770 [Candidatus Magasanikbacteria bacterium]|jgi:hypothetical protein